MNNKLSEKMTADDAMQIAEDWLAQQPWGDKFHVVKIMLEPDLALAFWTSRSGELIAGNAPLLIDTETGSVHVTGTARAAAYYVQNFRVTGDPHVEPLSGAKIVGWREGAKKVSAVMLLKENTDLGLAEAKASMDAVLCGRDVEVVPRQGVAAGDICARLDEVGFVAKETLFPPR